MREEKKKKKEQEFCDSSPHARINERKNLKFKIQREREICMTYMKFSSESYIRPLTSVDSSCVPGRTYAQGDRQCYFGFTRKQGY